MQSLKFLGRGGAFNEIDKNTSAYFIKDNILFLIDCGETVFSTLKANNKLNKLIEDNNIKDIQIYITHLHADHVGSLSTLIYYCYYCLGIKAKVYHPHRERGTYSYFLLHQLLRIQGHDEEYEFITKPHEIIWAFECPHAAGLKSYHYIINLNGKKIFYSGDCSSISHCVRHRFEKLEFDEIYLECSNKDNQVHLSFNYLDRILPKNPELRERISFMHIDNEESFELAKKYGFKIVELDN